MFTVLISSYPHRQDPLLNAVFDFSPVKPWTFEEPENLE